MAGVDVIALLTNFGFPGFMVVYLVWREREERKERVTKHELDRQLDRETNEANLELARSFVLLTETIRGLRE